MGQETKCLPIGFSSGGHLCGGRTARTSGLCCTEEVPSRDSGGGGSRWWIWELCPQLGASGLGPTASCVLSCEPPALLFTVARLEKS